MGDNQELYSYAVRNLYQFTSFKELFKQTIYKESDLNKFYIKIYTRLPVYTSLQVF